MSSVRDLLEVLVVRLGGLAERLGCAQTLGQVLAAIDGPGGAERQLAAVPWDRLAASLRRWGLTGD